MTASDRIQGLALGAEAVGCGSRQRTACEMVGVAERTLQRWPLPQTAEDGRRGPRTLFRWDITYLPSSIHGQYYYLYLFVDVCSRKAVGAEVHAEESMEHSSRRIDTLCHAEGVEKHQVSVHADNGGPMKGATMLAALQRVGSVPSFSRPSVSHDNPFSESLFRTLKYGPLYPTTPCARLDAARAWVATFMPWSHDEQLHRGIRFTTPASRWSSATRNWTRIARVTLKGETTTHRLTASGRSHGRGPERSP